jgi:hypothetical protein
MKGKTRPHRAKSEDAPLLKIMVVFEDTCAGLRARQAIESLPLPAGSEPAFKLKLWRWELLRDPLLKARAVREASLADVILLAGHSATELPLGVRDWLAQWLLVKRERPYALGVLLASDSAITRDNNDIRHFVQTVAETGKADFFFGCSQNVVFREDRESCSQQRRNYENIATS